MAIELSFPELPPPEVSAITSETNEPMATQVAESSEQFKILEQDPVTALMLAGAAVVAGLVIRRANYRNARDHVNQKNISC